MDSQSLKLDEFIAEYRFCGEWKVSYTDGTHLAKDKYVKLGDITIDASEEIAQEYPILPFSFKPVTAQQGLCAKHYERQRRHGSVYVRRHSGKPSRFSTEERVEIFRRIAGGDNLSEIARNYGVSRQYIWKLKQRYLKQQEVQSRSVSVRV